MHTPDYGPELLDEQPEKKPDCDPTPAPRPEGIS